MTNPPGLSPSANQAAVRVPEAEQKRIRPSVLIADEHPAHRSLLKGILKAEPYRVFEATTSADVLKAIQEKAIDLVVADLLLAQRDAFSLCRRIKSNQRHRLIPLLVLASRHCGQSEMDCLEAGADDFMAGPIRPLVFRTRLRVLLRSKRMMDSLEEAESIIFTLASVVEHRDHATGAHCERLAILTRALGQMLGLSDADLTALKRGSYLHDIGKVCVPDSILRKDGPLTPDEWAIMQSHTIKGETICRPMRTLAPVLPIIRSHHERWDGSGYPDGLAGDQIPLLARILQIADIFDALTSRRSYKPALSVEEAVQVLQAEAAQGWRDSDLVTAFVSMVRRPEGLAEFLPGRDTNPLDEFQSRDLISLSESLISFDVPAVPHDNRL